MHYVLSMRTAFVAATVLVAAGQLAWAPVAQACSLAYGIVRTEPEAGAMLPQGSAIVLVGYVDVAALSVDIDGTPTTIARDEGYPQQGYSWAYRLGTTPAVGSVVTLRDCSSEQPVGCDEVPPLSWTVGPADTEASAPAESVEFGIYDHRDVDTTPDTCSSDGVLDMTVYVHTRVPADGSGGAPRHALVELFDAETTEPLGMQVRSVPPEGGELSVALSVHEGVLGSPLAEAACVQVTVFDLAGHVSGSISSCEPDHVGADPDQSPDPSQYDAPEEPDWDSLSDPDDALGRGCACSAEEPRRSPWALLTLLVAASLRRRGPRRRPEPPSAR